MIRYCSSDFLLTATRGTLILSVNLSCKNYLEISLPKIVTLLLALYLKTNFPEILFFNTLIKTIHYYGMVDRPWFRHGYSNRLGH